jgi:hypothetical protein
MSSCIFLHLGSCRVQVESGLRSPEEESWRTRNARRVVHPANRGCCFAGLLGAGARTHQAPLVGLQHMELVAQVPVGVAARARLTLGAKVRRRRYGVVPFRADLPNVLREALLTSAR